MSESILPGIHLSVPNLFFESRLAKLLKETELCVFWLGLCGRKGIIFHLKAVS